MRTWAVGGIVFTCLLLLFGGWSVQLMIEVQQDRAEVERRVGWMIALQALEQEATREIRDEQSYTEQIEAVRRATEEMALALDTPSLIRLQALRDVLTKAELPGTEIVQRTSPLVRIVRGQTGALSQQLGHRWDQMRFLVLGTLALEVLMLALLTFVARARYHLEQIRRDLELEIDRQLTEREHMDTLLRRNDRLASIGTLAAGVAHEINNPLTYMLSNLEQVQDLGQQSPTSIDEMLALISEAREGAQRIAAVVRDLGAFTRPQGDEIPNATHLASVVASALALAALQLRGRAQIHVDVPPNLFVHATEGQLVQVLVNLLVNAIHAVEAAQMAERGHQIRILATTASDQVQLTVSDTGVGIPDDVMPRVFDPFFTTKGPGAGTGLGLFLCHRIVTRFGGTILIDSEPGLTHVRVTLASSVPRDPPPPVAASEPGAALRVLVLDDELLVARALARLLREHTVTITHTVAEALEHLESQPFDLVFCDLTLPRVPGRVLVETIRERHPTMMPRLVLMTGGTLADEDRLLLSQLGLRPITKPFDPSAVRTLVSRVSPIASD